jgi:homoserine O-succinyltransferase/O-acetyltransferase
MPICLDRRPSAPSPPVWANVQFGKSPVEFREADANYVDIGLVNNMPGAALEATERQFHAQLDAAADGVVVRLALYALPDVPRNDVAQRHLSSFYSDIIDLRDRHLDGLIVTGTEPRTSNLMDEPYWASLTRLMEWAESHTHSAIWSCLAAHAALLHIDGIVRRPLRDKQFGVFECARVSDHSLMAAVPAILQMPHSRWNDIAEDDLTACGYNVLTRSEDAGVDSFLKQRNSLFVFFQGHPEYEADTLLLEYRRDIRRFLRRERDKYPAMPRDYFDNETVDVLAALQERALSDRREELYTDFPTALAAGRVRNTWHSAAVRIYRNWLMYLCAQKGRHIKASDSRRRLSKPVRAVTAGSPQ